MVWCHSAGSAVEDIGRRTPGCLQSLGFGDYAPADAGGDGYSVLSAIYGPVSKCLGTGGIGRAGSAATMAGAGVLLKSEEFAAGGAGDRGEVRWEGARG